MFFTLRELVKWLGMTAFEIWMHLITVFVFSIVAALKYDQVINISWWMVFIPLFACDGLNAYFCIIVFIRMLKEDQDIRTAGLRLTSSLFMIVLLFIFKILLCQKLSQIKLISCSEIMIPLFILLQIVMIRACQVH